MLAGAGNAGTDPYEWLLQPLAGIPTILDLACGSGPLAGRAGPGWVGVDRSAAELAVARRKGASRLLCADAAGLPVASGSCAAVACSMALMILQPLDLVLTEIRRVLTDGGLVAVLLPGTLPVTGRDLLRYTRLMVALRRTHLDYPNDRKLRALGGRRRDGFQVVDDRRRRFAVPVPDAVTATRFVDSLYLPGVPDARLRAAAEVAKRWSGSEIGVPLRRVTLRRIGPRS